MFRCLHKAKARDLHFGNPVQKYCNFCPIVRTFCPINVRKMSDLSESDLSGCDLCFFVASFRPQTTQIHW